MHRFLRPVRRLRRLTVLLAAAALTVAVCTAAATPGREQTGIPSAAVDAYSPSWSPDGKWIAFFDFGRSASGSHLLGALMVMDAATGTHQYVIDGHDAGYASWSPDSKRLVYNTQAGGGLWIANFDGTGRHVIPGTQGADGDPDWSPDGKLIAYADASNSGTRGIRIWVVAPDGTGARELPLNPEDPQQAPYSVTLKDPDWSPDGQSLVFTFTLPHYICAAEVMRVDGSGAHCVSPEDQGGAWPKWSPNGRAIAFTATVTYVVNADGTAFHRALEGATPTWSPDGTRIAYARYEDNRRRTIHVAGLDGSGDVRLPHVAGCTIAGSNLDDTIVGTTANDVMCGLGGNDTMYGLSGDDRIDGGPGNDVLDGDSPAAAGGPGSNDIVIGGPGNDTVIGGPGVDVLLGGPGNDYLKALDRFRDRLDGGRGTDRALIDKAKNLRDVMKSVESFR